jgi:hypothetical protein
VFSVFGFLLVRAVVLAILVTMVVEQIRTDRVSVWSLRRSIRVLPTAITVNMVGLGAILIAGMGSQFLGQLGLGFFVFVAGMVLAVWATAAAPAIAADEDRTLSGSMQRSFRAARVPGGNGLTLASLYAIPAFAVTSALAIGGQIEVNPSILRWATTLGINLLRATAAAMFTYRYLAAAPSIPEAAPPSRRTR